MLIKEKIWLKQILKKNNKNIIYGDIMYKEETVNELLSEGNIAAKIGLELTEEKEPIKEVELEEAKAIGLKKLAKQLGSIFDKLDDAYVDISGDDVMSKSRKEAINNELA